MNINIENKASFEDNLSNGLNLFLGSGFSVLANDSEDRSLPCGSALTAELTDLFMDQAMGLSLPELCTIINHDHKEELRKYLEDRFTVKTYSASYDAIRNLPVKSIFTTNIDDLVYKIYSKDDQRYIHDVTLKGKSYYDDRAIQYYPLHGSVTNKLRKLLFSSEELSAAFSEDPDMWFSFKAILNQYPTLFWGYSLRDAGALRALYNDRDSRSDTHSDRWAVLHPDADEATKRYFRSLDCQLVIADTSEFLNYLHALSSSRKVSHRNCITTLDQQVEGKIPQIGDITVRPVSEFYTGVPPTWSDILSETLHTLSVEREVRNEINSGKHVIITGIPASGKTTLLMQLANKVSFNGIKLYYDIKSAESMAIVLRQLPAGKALVFLDNYTDSLEAYEMLIGTPDIQVVAADRTYNYEITSHKRDRRRTKIFDITELTKRDIQQCIDNIPKGFRNNKSLEKYESSFSLFELVEQHITAPTLSRRFVNVLSQLGSADEMLRDMLVLVCYLHSCRTPVSMGNLISFGRAYNADWATIRQMIKELKPLIEEEENEEDLSQDYFATRSTFVSEAVLNSARSNVLRNVLVNFHKHVSIYNIPRFHIFKRYGYDWKLVAKAFSNIKEGVSFYERAYHFDASPYLLQHTALYLAEKKDYNLAFSYIDRAVADTGGRVYSIRNSGAIILFKANIKFGHRPDSRRQLDESMRILELCYKSDRRKTFHAIKFAEQTLEYWDFYTDNIAKEYRDTSLKWLDEILLESPSSFMPKVLKARLESLF